MTRGTNSKYQRYPVLNIGKCLNYPFHLLLPPKSLTHSRPTATLRRWWRRFLLYRNPSEVFPCLSWYSISQDLVFFLVVEGLAEISRSIDPRRASKILFWCFWSKCARNCQDEEYIDELVDEIYWRRGWRQQRQKRRRRMVGGWVVELRWRRRWRGVVWGFCF